MAEFALSLVFLVPLLLGTFVFGFRLIRNLEMEQIVRDLCHMYIQALNFRNPGPQQSAALLASGYDLSSTGTSVVIFSKIRLVDQTDCDAGNPTKTAGTPCPNLNNPAFVEQVMVGNTSLQINGVNIAKSAFGTPPLDSNQMVSVADMANTSSAAAGNTAGGTGFAKVLVLKAGEYAYVTEMFNATPSLNVAGLTGAPQIYARSVF